MASPSIKTGWKAWIPKRCKVGALFNKTTLPFTTSSKIAQTSSVPCSISFEAPLTL